MYSALHRRKNEGRRMQRRRQEGELSRPLLVRPHLGPRLFVDGSDDDEELGPRRSSGDEVLLITPRKSSNATGKRRVAPRRNRNFRRMRMASSSDEMEQRVSVFCVGEEVKLQQLLKRCQQGLMKRPQVDGGEWTDKLWENAVHSSQESGRHIFFFAFGCVVLWGFQKAEEKQLVAGLLLDPAVFEVTSAEERIEAHDSMTYIVDRNTPSYCKNDVVSLSTDDPLEKISLSYALAQSAKLFIWEARVDVTIEEVKHIPERLAATGKTDLTEKEISQKIGKVFIERTQVNLHSEILDTPDFLWNDDAFEPGYLHLRKHLDLPERVQLLNDRLDILKELLDVLNTQLSNHHSSRLEIIVIWLIVAEIFVSLFTFLMDRFLPPRGRGGEM